MGDRELPSTAGALGNEKSRKRPKTKRRRRQSAGDDDDDDANRRGRRGGRKEREVIINKPSSHVVRPPFEETPKSVGENLCGRVHRYITSEIGVKKRTMKAVAPYHTGNLNTESFLHFIVHSNSQEFIRFDRNALSFVLYVQYAHANYQAGHANADLAAQYHAVNAVRSAPAILIDPDVMGSGFFTRAEVIINNTPVPTNSGIGDHFLHYVRSNRVFNAKNRDPHFTVSTQVAFPVGNAAPNPVMAAATRAFNLGDWNARNGVRVPIYLDGIFPFDLKCQTVQALENREPEKLHFPPNTPIEIKLFYQRDKINAIWHNEMTIAKYYDGAQAVDDPMKMILTVQSACLEYESVELHPFQHIELIKEFQLASKQGWFDYDIPRGQHQALAANVSSTDNTFQIMPHARLMIIMFLRDWATFVMEDKKRPLTGWSEFPANCTKIKIEYAGNDELITKSYERFGIRGEQNQWSKKAWYEYMKELRFTNATFDEFFPANANAHSMIQAFVFELRNHMSHQTQLLNMHMEFAAGNTSPVNNQIVVLTVHPNGKAVVKNVGTSMYDWQWDFLQPV